MMNNTKNIESLFSKILKEEIDKKSKDMTEKLHGNQRNLDVAKPKGKLTKADFDALRKRNNKKDVDEAETEEGNAFVGAVKKAKEKGEDSFNFKGKKFDVKEEIGNLNKKKDKIRVSEEELIDIIEDLAIKKINEVTDLDNMDFKTPQGLKKTKKVQDKTKDFNKDYINSVIKKFKEYLKPGSKSEYEENPTSFPKGNGELGEMEKKAYKASGAVEEYIENFARAAGLEELIYDEIEPHEDWVKDNIKGSARTGNNPKWGNAVETELGEKLFQKSQKKPYSTEKRKGSYKRQSQPIDKAGEHDGKKSIDDMFAKLESKEDEKVKLVSEEVNKIKNLYSYNAKTQ